MPAKKPILVTMGDPNGVGPCICARAWSRPALRGLGIVLVGSRTVLERALEAEGVRAEPREWSPGSAIEPDGVPFWEPAGLPPCDPHPGENRRDAGAQALRCVDAAVEACLSGLARAMVTAPLSKEAVAMTLPGFAGHTGHIASLCGAPDHCLALNHGKLWAAFTTTHVALRDVPGLITTDSVARTGRLLAAALERSGTASPRIGVAGLNPHAGEHGLFGDEEEREIGPAVELLRREGVDATGPFPSDVVFPMLKAGRIDGVVCLYHDQGHPVMKTLGFDLRRNRLRGVNVTLGLPIVRTSPDHGTGFDIAWRERADDGSLADALRLADRLARRRPRS